MGDAVQRQAALNVGLLLRPCLRPNPLGCMAFLDARWRVCYLSGSLRSSVHCPDQIGPACYEICGCGQLLPRWITRPLTPDGRDPTVASEQWIFRCRRYRLLHV